MSDIMFRPGLAYVGTATADSGRKKIFQIVSRSGRTVSLMHVKNVVREMADDCDGTEVVKIKDSDGFDYFLSARAPVDIDTAFSVVRMCQA